MDFGDKRCRVLFSQQVLAERIAALGKQITLDYRDVADDLVVVAVLKGSVIFLADLLRAIDLPLTLETIGIASYGDQTQSSGVVQITSDFSRPIAGKHILLVEDIVDTGLTMKYLLDNFRTRKPESVKVCSLLHKPSRAEVKVPIDYLGFEIPNEFVIGFGLDYVQRYRNIPYIGILENKT